MIKVRANQITIDSPKEGGEPWIRIMVQRVEKSGDIYNVVDRYDSFNVRLSKVFSETYPLLFDPSNATMTVGDIGTMLTFVVSNWLAAKYNGTINPETGDVILEE